MSSDIYDVIIIGSGPAGLTAGLYTSRANLKTLILAGRVWGGQLMLTTEVENFPGFPEGIMGPDLMMKMRAQTEKHGAKILDVNFTLADFSPSSQSFSGQAKLFKVITDDEKSYQSKSIIIATGAQTKWLEIPGEKEKIGRGVSSCAPCDAAFYRNKKVIVVGGGDSAMEEALVLTKFASHVYIMHRKDSFRASKIMQDKVFSNEKITIVWNTEIQEIIGEQKVQKVKLHTKNVKLKIKSKNEDKEIAVEEINGEKRATDNGELIWELPIDGVFVAIGHVPNSQLFQGIETDKKGFIKVTDHTKTNIDGVFVAGDVYDAQYKQAITASGLGCMAALDTEKWLEMSH